MQRVTGSVRAPALRLDDDNDPELEHRLAKVPILLLTGLTEFTGGLVQFRGENGEFALTKLNRCYHCDD